MPSSMIFRAAWDAHQCRMNDGNRTACQLDRLCKHSNATGNCYMGQPIDLAMAELLMCKMSTFSRYARQCYAANTLKECVRVHRHCVYFARTYLPRGVPDRFHCVIRSISDPREAYAAFKKFEGDGTVTDGFGTCSTSPLVQEYFARCQKELSQRACVADPMCLWRTGQCEHAVLGSLAFLLQNASTPLYTAIAQAHNECKAVDVSGIKGQAQREEACMTAGGGMSVQVNLEAARNFSRLDSVSDIGAAGSTAAAGVWVLLLGSAMAAGLQRAFV